MINSTGQPIMPGGVDATTGMINTSGQPWMPGSNMDSGRPLMYGDRNVGRGYRGGYRWALPQPPPSGPGRIIITLVPNIASPQDGGWTPQLDGNMDFVLRGNDTWVNAAILTSLMADIRRIQLGPHPFAQAATSARRFFVFMALGMLAWFILSGVLMQNDFSNGGLNMGRNSIIIFAGLIILAICGFKRMFSRQRQIRETLQGLTDACTTFARTWSSKPENSMYELTYRMGLTDPTYFELSPIASRFTAPPGVVADPAQAMYPSAPPPPV